MLCFVRKVFVRVRAGSACLLLFAAPQVASAQFRLPSATPLEVAPPPRLVKPVDDEIALRNLVVGKWKHTEPNGGTATTLTLTVDAYGYVEFRVEVHTRFGRPTVVLSTASEEGMWELKGRTLILRERDPKSGQLLGITRRFEIVGETLVLTRDKCGGKLVFTKEVESCGCGG